LKELEKKKKDKKYDFDSWYNEEKKKIPSSKYVLTFSDSEFHLFGSLREEMVKASKVYRIETVDKIEYVKNAKDYYPYFEERYKRIITDLKVLSTPDIGVLKEAQNYLNQEKSIVTIKIKDQPLARMMISNATFSGDTNTT